MKQTGCFLGMLASTTGQVQRQIQECMAYASKFANTCTSNSDPIDFDTHEGQIVSCTGEMVCPGTDAVALYTTESPCQWTRKLCVSCTEDIQGLTVVRVQSNTLPNHCFVSEGDAIRETNTDWTVRWDTKDNLTYVDYARKDIYNSRVALDLPDCVETTNNKRRFAITLGLDGAKPAAIERAFTPSIDSLVANGLYSWEATIQNGQTYTSPGFTSIMTGVNPSKHGVFQNYDLKEKSDFYKSWLWRGKHDFGLQTLAIVNWDQFPGGIIEQDACTYRMTDLETDPEGYSKIILTDEDLQIITDGDYQMIYVSLDAADYCGHMFGFEVDEYRYIKALEHVDRQIRRILEAIEARPTRQEEEWLVAVSTDHSGRGTAHNFLRAEESRKIFVILSGDGLSKNQEIPKDDKIPVSHKDIFPSIIEYLGLEFGQDWDLDGRSRISWGDGRIDCQYTDIRPVIALSGAYIYDDGSQSSCESMVSSEGRLHYKTWMQYMNASQGQSSNVSQCNTVLEKSPMRSFQEPIGLAMDGRRVFGPYNSVSGLQWEPENHDSCNGVLTPDGSYTYISTVYEPFNVGCWGPTNNAIYITILSFYSLILLL